MTSKQARVARQLLEALQKFDSEVRDLKKSECLAKGVNVDSYMAQLKNAVVKGAAMAADVPFGQNASTAEVLAAMIDSIEPERFKSMPPGVELNRLPPIHPKSKADQFLKSVIPPVDTGRK